MKKRFSFLLKRSGVGPLRRLRMRVKGRWLNLNLTRWKLRR